MHHRSAADLSKIYGTYQIVYGMEKIEYYGGNNESDYSLPYSGRVIRLANWRRKYV